MPGTFCQLDSFPMMGNASSEVFQILLSYNRSSAWPADFDGTGHLAYGFDCHSETLLRVLGV